MPKETCINICNEHDIVHARRIGRDIVKKIGFSLVDQSHITTAISELARNIYFFANKGEICLKEISRNHEKGICITAMDQGPGIYDIRKILEDGYSTTGGLGAGLPGVKRLMDDFDLKTGPREGTRIKVIKWI